VGNQNKENKNGTVIYYIPMVFHQAAIQPVEVARRSTNLASPSHSKPYMIAAATLAWCIQAGQSSARPQPNWL